MHVVSLFISTLKVAIFRQEKVLLERSLSSVHKCLLFLLEAKFKLTGRFFILKEYQSATRRSPFADNKKVGWWKFSKKLYYRTYKNYGGWFFEPGFVTYLRKCWNQSFVFECRIVLSRPRPESFKAIRNRRQCRMSLGREKNIYAQRRELYETWLRVRLIGANQKPRECWTCVLIGYYYLWERAPMRVWDPEK